MDLGDYVICSALVTEMRGESLRTVFVSGLETFGTGRNWAQELGEKALSPRVTRYFFSLSYLDDSETKRGLKVGAKSRTLDEDKFIEFKVNQAEQRNLL